MAAFEQYVARNFLLEKYSNLPRGRYVSLFIIRKTESETIFRTEGSGEGLVKETVSAGIEDTTPLRRVVISKRKQTAVERRTGREFLRDNDLLLRGKTNKDGGKEAPICMLNTNQPCERCVDCFLYGFAAGGGGAQKSRVLTDDAYSIGPVSLVTDRRTFNATYDDGTMRHPVTKEASRSINEDEYVRPQTHFLDIETLKDVTLPEMQYVVGNVLRSSRYGAISSRMGKITNNIVAIAFSDCELFSNLELTQKVYDKLRAQYRDKDELPFPIADKELEPVVAAAIEELLGRVFGRRPVVVQGTELNEELRGVAALYPEKLVTALRALTEAYPN